MFETIAQHIAELAHVLRGYKPAIRVENGGVLQRAYALGRGVVGVGAHFGSFGLLGFAPKLLGYKGSIILTRQLNQEFARWASRSIKQHFGAETIFRDCARDQVVDMLERGYVVGFVSDRYARTGGFPATFFSRRVVAVAGPAVYAKRCGSPIVVMTISRGSDGTHVIRVDGPISSEGSLEEISQRWLSTLEARIREHPEQWIWPRPHQRAERNAVSCQRPI